MGRVGRAQGSWTGAGDTDGNKDGADWRRGNRTFWTRARALGVGGYGYDAGLGGVVCADEDCTVQIRFTDLASDITCRECFVCTDVCAFGQHKRGGGSGHCKHSKPHGVCLVGRTRSCIAGEGKRISHLNCALRHAHTTCSRLQSSHLTRNVLDKPMHSLVVIHIIHHQDEALCESRRTSPQQGRGGFFHVSIHSRKNITPIHSRNERSCFELRRSEDHGCLTQSEDKEKNVQ